MLNPIRHIRRHIYPNKIRHIFWWTSWLLKEELTSASRFLLNNVMIKYIFQAKTSQDWSIAKKWGLVRRMQSYELLIIQLLSLGNVKHHAHHEPRSITPGYAFLRNWRQYQLTVYRAKIGASQNVGKNNSAFWVEYRWRSPKTWVSSFFFSIFWFSMRTHLDLRSLDGYPSASCTDRVLKLSVPFTRHGEWVDAEFCRIFAAKGAFCISNKDLPTEQAPSPSSKLIGSQHPPIPGALLELPCDCSHLGPSGPRSKYVLS